MRGSEWESLGSAAAVGGALQQQQLVRLRGADSRYGRFRMMFDEPTARNHAACLQQAVVAKHASRGLCVCCRWRYCCLYNP